MCPRRVYVPMVPMNFAARVFDPARAFGTIAFLAPLLSVYLPLSLAIVLPVGAVLSLVCRYTAGSPIFRFDWLPGAVLGGVLLIAGISAAWSLSPDLTFDKLSRTAMATIAGLVFYTAMKGLDGEATKRVLTCFLAGMGIALILIIIERASGGLLIRGIAADRTQNSFLNQFNRPLSLLSALIWPAVSDPCAVGQNVGNRRHSIVRWHLVDFFKRCVSCSNWRRRTCFYSSLLLSESRGSGRRCYPCGVCLACADDQPAIAAAEATFRID